MLKILDLGSEKLELGLQVRRYVGFAIVELLYARTNTGVVRMINL